MANDNENPMSYRVIALDLDGTLLDNQKRILPQSLEALAQARAAGVQVVVVTGRHHVAIHPFYQALQIDTPAICCNGTYLYDFQQKRCWPPIRWRKIRPSRCCRCSSRPTFTG